jgi:tetratricopeptide (TPR) repeat protein
VGKVDQQFEHLSDAQIENYGNRTGAGPNQPDNDQAIETHLSSCEACRARLLAFHRSRFSLTSTQRSPSPDFPATADCPSEDSLRSLVAGLAIPGDSAALMQHIAQCDHCGPILRAYTEDFSDELSASDAALLNQINSASLSWQNKIARQLAEAASAQAVSSVSPSSSSADLHSASKNDPVAQPGPPASPVLAGRGGQPPSAVQVKPSVLDENDSENSGAGRQSLTKPSRFHLPRLKWLLVPTGAIACLLIAFFIWNAQRETPEKVEKLLAQAYTEQRTMEMRIPYAAHSDFKQTRGDSTSLLSSPESLRKATDIIAANLKKNPDDPQWLLLSARLDLLDWRYQSSLSTLNKIEDDKVEDSRDFRLTQSLALYEKAETEHDPQSYGQVVDLLGRTLQKAPDDSVALFNQAIACEKLYMYECARKNYEHFLKVDPNSGWSSEAREHLNRIKEKKTSGLNNSVIFSTPTSSVATSTMPHA